MTFMERRLKMIDPMFGLREGMEKKRKRREMIDPNF